MLEIGIDNWSRVRFDWVMRHLPIKDDVPIAGASPGLRM
jgi:hypothetical protein